MLVSCWVFTAPKANAEGEGGRYYVEIDVNIKKYTVDYTNPYTGPFFGKDESNSPSTNKYKQMAGITLFYKDKNGTGYEQGADSATNKIYNHQKYENFGIGKNDEVHEKDNDATKPHIAGSNGLKTMYATISGFPTGFAVYNNRSGGPTDNWAEWSVKEIRIGASADSALTSIWKGDCFTSNRDGAYPARWLVEQNGNVERWDNNYMTVSTVNDSGGGKFWVWNEYYNGGDENANLSKQTGDPDGNTSNVDESKCQTYTHNSTFFIGKDVAYYTGTNANTYKRAWAMPTPTSITSCTGSASVAIPTDNSTTTTGAYTVGEVQDQYGVKWHEDVDSEDFTLESTATIDGATKTVSGVVLDNQKRLNITNEANAANDYDVILHQEFGSIVKRDAITLNTFDYNVTFQDASGNIIRGVGVDTDTQTVDYGASATAPANQTKSSDDDYHYTYNGWNGTYQNITSGPQTKLIGPAFTSEEHTYGAPTNPKADPTCTENGYETKYCTVCNRRATDVIPALGHNPEKTAIAPGDGTSNVGYIYYDCSRCSDICWTDATYNASTGKWEPDDSTKYESTVEEGRKIPAADVMVSTGGVNDLPIVPAPSFNTFKDLTFDGPEGHDYSRKGASLKISAPYEYTDLTTTQGTRFSASSQVPDGLFDDDGKVKIASPNGTEDGVLDIGYLYSIKTYVPIGEGSDYSAYYSRLVVGNVNTEENPSKVYKTSVVSQNAGKAPYDDNDNWNWKGVSVHEYSDFDPRTEEDITATVLTFNLVINIKAKNWETNYCARPYITYRYNGLVFTVYDEGEQPDAYYRNVADVAYAAYTSGAETVKVTNYCRDKILIPLGILPSEA